MSQTTYSWWKFQRPVVRILDLDGPRRIEAIILTSANDASVRKIRHETNTTARDGSHRNAEHLQSDGEQCSFARLRGKCSNFNKGQERD